jgi:hypothetical protein
MTTFLQFVKRLLVVVVGVIAAAFCFFVCQGVFSGYPQYGTNILGPLGMFLIALTGGVAWIIDQRRIDAES